MSVQNSQFFYLGLSKSVRFKENKQTFLVGKYIFCRIFASNVKSIFTMPTIKIHITDQQLEKLHINGEIVITLGDHSPQTQQMSPVQTGTMSFFEYIRQWAAHQEQTGNLRTAETYRSALSQFCRFRQNEDLPLSAITPVLMEQFQSYLRSRQLTMNTVSFFMRILRSIYHKGVKQGLAIDNQPFRSVYTGNAQTQKRALSRETIQRIRQLQPDSPQLLFARDMFLLSFYLRGMSFVDMAYLKRSDIHDGHITYKRHKTGQMLTIRWEQQMQDIVDRYPNTETDYLLPIIRKQNGKERNQYRNCQTHINRDLKEIARLTGISINLTMYCARHSWATIARDMQVPMNVISRAMGHVNERTTEIYIRSVDTDTVDRINEQIMQMI